jgi:hypothetical protein
MMGSLLIQDGRNETTHQTTLAVNSAYIGRSRCYWVAPPQQHPPLPTIHSLPAEWLDTTD